MSTEVSSSKFSYLTDIRLLIISLTYICCFPAPFLHYSVSSMEEISDESDSIVDDSDYIVPEKHHGKRIVQDNYSINHPITPGREISPGNVFDSTEWISKYTPDDPKDIAIHPRKLKDVLNVLQSMLKGNQGPAGGSSPRILVLQGPSGALKLTVVKTLARSFLRSPELTIEYHDPEDFESFLSSCRYRVGRSKLVILIEEYPNVLHAPTHWKFQQALLQWVNFEQDLELPPLVICVTEIEFAPEDISAKEFYSIQNNINAQTLLGKQVMNDKRVKLINFNPIAPTILKKALQNIFNQVWNENRHYLNSRGFNKRPLQLVIEEAAQTGDIRSAINMLEFKIRWGLHNYADFGFKESHLSLYHGIGKVIYGSKDTSNRVFAEPGQTNLFRLSLLENYAIFNHPDFGCEAAAKIADILSVADLISNEAKDIATFGTRAVFQSIGENRLGKRGRGLKFPGYFKIIKEYNRVKLEVREYHRYVRPDVSFRNLNELHGYYEPLIFNRRDGKRLLYNRLGGKFREIHPTEEIPTIEGSNLGIFGVEDQYKEDVEMARRKMENSDGDASDALSEEIDDSEDNTEDLEDDFDDDLDNEKIDQILSQARPIKLEVKQIDEEIKNGDTEKNIDTGSDFSSDEELNAIIKRRKL